MNIGKDGKTAKKRRRTLSVMNEMLKIADRTQRMQLLRYSIIDTPFGTRQFGRGFIQGVFSKQVLHSQTWFLKDGMSVSLPQLLIPLFRGYS
jgi:hypothetical protein